MSGDGAHHSARRRRRYEYVGTEPVPGGNSPILFIRGTVFAEGFPRRVTIEGDSEPYSETRVALNEYSNGTMVISQGQEFDLVIGEGGVIEAGEAGNLSWQRTLLRFQPTAATPRAR